MSVSRWAYIPERCDGDACPGDCDRCSKAQDNVALMEATMMNDTISRQAAIDALCDNCDTVQAVCPHYPCKQYLKIEKLPSTQRWIPVTERLPEKNGMYLVTYQDWGALEVDWNIWITEQKPSWLWEQGVTAWMPLPKPYKEDGDNDG